MPAHDRCACESKEDCDQIDNDSRPRSSRCIALGAHDGSLTNGCVVDFGAYDRFAVHHALEHSVGITMIYENGDEGMEDDEFADLCCFFLQCQMSTRDPRPGRHLRVHVSLSILYCMPRCAGVDQDGGRELKSDILTYQLSWYFY
jgi:hypothetical protein